MFDNSQEKINPFLFGMNNYEVDNYMLPNQQSFNEFGGLESFGMIYDKNMPNNFKDSFFDEKSEKQSCKDIDIIDDKFNFKDLNNHQFESEIGIFENKNIEPKNEPLINFGNAKTKASTKIKTFDLKISGPNQNLDNNIEYKEKINKKFLCRKKARNEPKITKITKNDENQINLNKKGRKKKDDKNKGDHTKHSSDNIMRKIKSNYLNYMHKVINDNIKNNDLKLLKLNSSINENLKRDYNIQLMERTLKDLYENCPISTKYRKKAKENSNINKKLIELIYSPENLYKESDAINILNSTYIQSFNEFKQNHINTFLNEIYDEEKEKNENEENIQTYLDKVKSLCINYQKWFEDKKGRNRSKNNE